MSNHKITFTCAGCGQPMERAAAVELADLAHAPTTPMLGGIPNAVGAVETPVVHGMDGVPNTQCAQLARRKAGR